MSAVGRRLRKKVPAQAGGPSAQAQAVSAQAAPGPAQGGVPQTAATSWDDAPKVQAAIHELLASVDHSHCSVRKFRRLVASHLGYGNHSVPVLVLVGAGLLFLVYFSVRSSWENCLRCVFSFPGFVIKNDHPKMRAHELFPNPAPLISMLKS